MVRSSAVATVQSLANMSLMPPPPPSGRHLSWPVLGKVEGAGELWHGHVSAVTVSPDFRRMGLARGLMDLLEQVSHEM